MVKHSNESREHLSRKRKEWLRNNPDKHPWKKNSKFISVPCEKLKEFLRENSVEFVEEVLPSTEFNYSVDILIQKKNLIIEVNGNQHYESNGTLKSYYQKRHDHLVGLGWKVLEIHYSTAFNHQLILDLINTELEKSTILPFRIKEKKVVKNKYGNWKDAGRARSLKAEEKYKPIIKELLESNIDLNHASRIIGAHPGIVSRWMKRYMPDFYEKECFKRKMTQ
jgi:hypothetical protein